MRAQTVNFERGQNPLTSLGVGILNSTKDVNSSEELIDWLIQILPILLKTKKIPSDIISQEGCYINNKYFNIIAIYIDKKINYIGPAKQIIPKSSSTYWTEKIPWVKGLSLKLKKLGFKTQLKYKGTIY